MKITAVLLLLLLSTGMVSASGLDSVFIKANSYYQQKKYAEAVLCYETIVKSGNESTQLYYNLGNSYFKNGEIAKSILYYEKALKLTPGDQDIIYNLSIANSRITDKINVLPELFFITWFKNARNSLKADSWSWLTVVFFTTMLLTILGFLLLQSIPLRKISASVAILSLFGFIIFLVFAGSSYNARSDESNAIIMSPSVVTKSSPDETATDLFVIHEGTKVKIHERFENWCEIEISDGNRGWILSNNYEII